MPRGQKKKRRERELLHDEQRTLGYTNTASALCCQITKTVTSYTARLMQTRLYTHKLDI